jgi:hypothetical protein
VLSGVRDGTQTSERFGQDIGAWLRLSTEVKIISVAMSWIYDSKIIRHSSAIEEDIPITDPAFYSSELLCPDSLIEHIFRPAVQSTETMPLLKERIAIMRQVGFILCTVRKIP